MTHPKRATLCLLGAIGSINTALVATVSRAEATTVTCDQLITQDILLDADVGPCPGNGIIIGADNITVDLNAHTVFGSSATPTPPGLDGLFPPLPSSTASSLPGTAVCASATGR